MCKLNITHSDVFYSCMCPLVLNNNNNNNNRHYNSYQKDLEISLPFSLRQQFISIMWKSRRPSPCCKWSKHWLWEGLGTMLHVIPCCKSYGLTSLIFMHAPPRFLSLTIQQAIESQVVGWERGFTVYSLVTLSKKKLHTHMKYKSISAMATWQIQLLLMPSHPPHYTEQKYYRQKVAYFCFAIPRSCKLCLKCRGLQHLWIDQKSSLQSCQDGLKSCILINCCW